MQKHPSDVFTTAAIRDTYPSFRYFQQLLKDESHTELREDAKTKVLGLATKSSGCTTPAGVSA